MIQSMTLPGGVSVKMPGLAPKLSETPGEVRWPGPTLGQHTDAVLAELGYDTAQIAGLRTRGAVA
jgi:crotonobetainyl-CoA:carnitine CoA-transferase CaiB-like acyl-CoA transferase